MRNRSLILLAAVLAIVFVGVAGVYAYDQTGHGTIAEGVSVAGIDVGGLDGAQARSRLEREYVARLRTPIVVHHGTRTFVLTADESKTAPNVSALVDQALAEGRDDSIVTRTWRRLTGSDLGADVAPSAVYDKAASVRLLDRIRLAVDRAPQDAGVSFSAKGMVTTPGRDGLEVLASELHAQIDSAIVDPRAERTIVAQTRKTPPAVTNDQIAEKYKTVLVVDRKKFQLDLYEDLKLAKTYNIAVGAVGLETPAGLYHIQNKAINPAWTKPHSSWIKKDERGDVVPGGTPQNPLKARWLGIFDGAGIHGIDPSEYGSIGHAASHGCVRMRIPDVIDLYPKVPVGTPIYIA